MENAAAESVPCLLKPRDEIQGGTAEMSHTQWPQQNTKSEQFYSQVLTVRKTCMKRREKTKANPST